MVSHYRLVKKLGAGGMGIVYEALDVKLDRIVALKFLPHELCRDDESKTRFVHEAKAASALDHPNVCNIHEIGETEDGQVFIAMACYKGETLKDRILRGQLPIEEAVEIALEVAEGLAKVHKHGIVHRDIKPANVFLTEEGLVKILDFGLARFSGLTRMTKTGETLGTVAYMSPEQARGASLDHRTDIWSLGAVLYEMVTGEMPFKGANGQAVIYSIMNEAPRAVRDSRPDLPTDLERQIHRALSKEPSERHQTTVELIHALKSLKRQFETTRVGVVSKDATPLPSIAVLPFTNMSPDPENQYFGDGLTEELINALVQIEGLRVAARTSTFRFRGEGVDIREIGEKLSVDTLLEGSVRKSGKRLRITAQLVNISDGYHLWSKRFDREMQDIFDIQDEIARAIVDQLKVKLVGPKDRPLVSCGTESLEAYTAVLEGRYYLHSLTPEGWEKSLALLQKSIELDPSFAVPHAWLSDYYQSLGWWGNSPPVEVMPKSREFAQRAIELDDNLGLPHASMAVVLFSYDRDFHAAEREFDRALELDPTSGDSRVRNALFLSCRGSKDEAIAEARLALTLEPLDGLLAAWAASALMGAGEIEESIGTSLRAVAMDANHWQSHMFLGLAFLHASREGEAAAALERAADLSGGASSTLAILGVAYYVMGKKSAGDLLANRLAERSKQEYVAPWLFACLCEARGEKSAALAYLKRAIEERDLFVSTDNVFPPHMRLSGPEADELLKGAGLRRRPPQKVG